jgi:C1A family cysteine protease
VEKYQPGDQPRALIKSGEIILAMRKSAGRLLLAGAFLAAAGSLGAQTAQLAPLNPAFLRHQEQRAINAAPAGLVMGHKTGYAPAPLDLSHLQQQVAAPASRSLPAAYDLRDQNKLTPVRNQGGYGTCWAFACYGSLESWLMPSETCNFSENNLANKHGFDYGFDDGGNATMTAAYLARWSGPVNEADDPYPNPGSSPSNLAVRKHIQQVEMIPAKTSALANDVIKSVVLNNGAMYVSMYIASDYYNSTNAAYYYAGNTSANHAVAIVGWNDAYPGTNFLSAPPGDGAYIVRNSWGADWGAGGYFYCSYYDTLMGFNENVSFNNAESPTNYGCVYQYDPLGWVSSCSSCDSSTDGWAANIFTAVSNGVLRAVGFYTTDVNVHYELYVYRGITAGAPRSGTLAASQSGTIPYAGYHTVPLASAVSVLAGQLFSVVIKFSNPAYIYPIPIEYALAGYSSCATAAPGQSFISPTGLSWYDLTTNYSTANVCIKAFAGPAVVIPSVPLAADFDGDALADPAVYIEDSGTWRIMLSGSGYAALSLNSYLGGSGWQALAGDFDGDAKADPAVYEATTATWRIKLSSSSYATTSLPGYLGGSNYIALAGDFDGDAKADPAVYLPATPATLSRSDCGQAVPSAQPMQAGQAGSGTWIVKLSSANYLEVVKPDFLGWADYAALAADFDGDAKADPAVYKATNALWMVMLSRSGYSTLTLGPNFLGGTGWTALAADFDGDRLADPAVKESASNNWIVKLSSGGYASVPVTWIFE